MDFNVIKEKFGLVGELTEAAPYGFGHINSTYCLVIKDGEESIVALKDGVLSIDVAAGSGMFVIPLKQKA